MGTEQTLLCSVDPVELWLLVWTLSLNTFWKDKELHSESLLK